MTILPAKNIVVCTPAAGEQTESGIVIAGIEGKQPVKGVVETIGKGVKPCPFKIGDTLCFLQYGANKVEIAGKQYYFVTFKDILGTIT